MRVKDAEFKRQLIIIWEMFQRAYTVDNAILRNQNLFAWLNKLDTLICLLEAVEED